MWMMGLNVQFFFSKISEYTGSIRLFKFFMTPICQSANEIVVLQRQIRLITFRLYTPQRGFSLKNTPHRHNEVCTKGKGFGQNNAKYRFRIPEYHRYKTQ